MTPPVTTDHRQLLFLERTRNQIRAPSTALKNASEGILFIKIPPTRSTLAFLLPSSARSSRINPAERNNTTPSQLTSRRPLWSNVHTFPLALSHCLSVSLANLILTSSQRHFPHQSRSETISLSVSHQESNYTPWRLLASPVISTTPRSWR